MAGGLIASSQSFQPYIGFDFVIVSRCRGNLDRSPKGVVTTPYGEALLARGRAAFDELRQGIRDIEFIADPRAGELRIGCPESIAAGLLVPVLAHLSKRYPRVRFHVEPVYQPTVEFPQLHERKVDLVHVRERYASLFQGAL